MGNLLIYGSLTSDSEVENIIKNNRNKYNKIILANERKSDYIIGDKLKNKVDLFISYENTSELELFEKMNYDLININEIMYCKYDYKISIIIPVYNTEEYIQETLDSIINQSMNFKDIQVILINDGSTDNSDFILTKYKNLYPNNIKYISKENGGVSVARNLGLKYVRGKYINFIDSDDKWGLTTFQNVYNFFEKQPSIDVVSTRLSFFDNMVGEHPLNYKYEPRKNKIVNLEVDYENIQMNASSAFFRASSIKGMEFDTTLKYAEDAKFVYNILKRTYKIGLMSYTQGCYWYRKRKNETSAIDNALSRETFYNSTIEKFHMYLVEDNPYKLPKYVQMMILYDLQYRLRFQEITLSTLNSKKLEIYADQIIKLLKLMDDDVISNSHLKQINAVYQIAILAVKHEGTNFKIQNIDGIYKVYSNDIFIKNVKDMYLKTEYIYEKNSVLKCGFSLPNINMNIDIIPILLINNREVVNSVNDTVITEQKFLNKNISYNKFYRFDLKLNSEIKSIEVKYLINNSFIEEINEVSKTHRTNFSNTKVPFKQYNNKTLQLFQNKKFINVSKKRLLVIKNLLGLLQKSNTRKSALYKFYGIITKKSHKNQNIWLFVDRLDKSGDNAEALFRYVEKNRVDITPYYLINSTSPDFTNLKKEFGNKIVAFNSKTHHMLMFRTKKLFSSHSEDYLNNPFGTINGKFIRELLDFEFVFLQHGVIQNDLSTLLHKRNKPMDYFITSSKNEKNEIIEKYGFNEEEVLLTGLPRFDLLKHNINKNKRIITIMPTWRPQLLELNDRDFLNSKFFKGYFEMLSHPKLKELTEKNNVNINLYLHPRMQKRFSKFFEKLDYVTTPHNLTYKEIISESNILITDVSSVAFDVAYLRKPIIYFHYDIDEIYKYSAYKPGYFEYKSMGFGPVVYNTDEIINEIIKIKIKNYKTSPFYLKRINKFFEYNDNINCSRLLKMIE
ncbi:CDP-glycerol glycerophosphotransferase family protein [Mammaliicoccus vitulinus]|uniref:bifunctional glycosyltransferase/CDP-glycerol:glycerophosphate glycerophosphotransferase n=1 Tax=Mammaliicoccus vitulinus TaxID=71237 RepID=UPI00194E90C9|nr:CDP-glycerol glycerophosphotransferase family protein [Mammaliicoccus vitulinus]MBM6629601.1 CDP-glycerol glycerophosphotransferase family protein [Mammaliicoccus vitulinus]